MLDDAQGSDDKTHLTPKEQVQPIPVCTVMSDGSLKVQASQIPLVDLSRLLLSAAGVLTERTVQRAAAMERVLVSISQRFDGFDAETEKAIATVLGAR
jgi:hypothetical protein